MIFEAPYLLILAPLLGAALWFAAWFARRRRIQAARSWSPSLAAEARRSGWWTPWAFGLIGALMGFAAAGPRSGEVEVTAKSRALSLVMAVDISRSMLAEDVAPASARGDSRVTNRLQRAVREARRLTQDLGGDRLGLVAFAGRSYILTPLTIDGGALRLYLDALDPEVASQGGTSLGAALSQGRELLTASTDPGDKVLVVFTDAETHDTILDDLAAAKAVATAGIRLVLVAEGGTEPARIPIRDSAGTVVEYKLDDQGQVVRTQRRDDVLQAIADAGEGTVVAADVPDQAGAIRELIATYKRSPTAQTRVADLAPRAWIPIVVAIVLLLLQTVTRKGAALAVLLLGLAGPLHAQRPSPGDRAIAAGETARAASEYLQEARGLEARDTAFYNAGTAALGAGRLDVAQGALAEAAKSLDPALRYRALYNLGVALLLAARADTSRAEQLLEQASERLREALLLQPSSERAKWNLELAQRRRPPSSGGGGGGGGKGGGGGNAPPPPEQPQPQGGINQNQAEQILNSMERQERKTRIDQQRRLQKSSGGGERDW